MDVPPQDAKHIFFFLKYEDKMGVLFAELLMYLREAKRRKEKFPDVQRNKLSIKLEVERR